MIDKGVKKTSLFLRSIIFAVVTALCIFCLSACGTGGSDKHALEAPDNLKVVDEILSWDEVEGADGYEVEIDRRQYKTDKAELDTFLITDTTKTYTMRVKAVDSTKSKSESAWSEEIKHKVTVAGITGATLINDATAYEINAQNISSMRGKLIIPEKYKGLPVATIEGRAFAKCTDLSCVYIPDTVTTIGDSAFIGCDNLTRVRLPSDLTELPSYMFSGCESLKSIELPDSLKTIEGGTFMGCKSLTEIVIPKSLEQLGMNSFAKCDSLTTLTIDPNNTVYKSDGNCVIRLSDNVLVCGIGTSVIPDYVSEIQMYAFASCTGLTEITVPGSVDKIDHYAFLYCTSLKKVTIESGVRSISDKVFQDCTALEDVVLPDTLREIYDLGSQTAGLFRGCGNVRSISVVGSAPNPIFKSDGNCIIRIADNAVIAGCMASVIPDYVESLEYYSFAELPITHITLKTNNTAEKEYGVIELPTGLKSMNRAFAKCTQLRTVQLPDEVTVLGSSFSGCTCLETVIISANSKLTEFKATMLSKSTMYTSHSEMPDGWSHNTVVGVITGCSFGNDDGRLYVDSFVLGESRAWEAGQNLYVPYRQGYMFKGWAKDARDGDLLGGLVTEKRGDSDIRSTYISGYRLSELPTGTVLYAVWEKESAAQ